MSNKNSTEKKCLLEELCKKIEQDFFVSGGTLEGLSCLHFGICRVCEERLGQSGCGIFRQKIKKDFSRKDEPCKFSRDKQCSNAWQCKFTGNTEDCPLYKKYENQKYPVFEWIEAVENKMPMET